MLRFGLVLLLATSALAAPSLSQSDNVSLELTEESTGRSHIIDGVFNRIDGGEVSIYSVTMHQILNDISDKNDQASRAYAVGNALGTALTFATGLPGDACLSAQLIQAYTDNNPASLRKALYNFITQVAKNLKLIVRFVRDRQSARYTVGPQTHCKGSGRSYRFEEAWNAITDHASPQTAGLVKEQYCTAKRLYHAFDIRNNLLGAIITASSLPPVTNIYRAAYPQMLNFVRAVGGNGNLDRALGDVQLALLKAVQKP